MFSSQELKNLIKNFLLAFIYLTIFSAILKIKNFEYQEFKE